MRNKKISETSEELETACKRYADLYDFAPVGYCMMDKGGIIREINAAAAEQLGTDKDSLLDTPLSHHIADEDRKIFFSHIQQAFETQTRQTCDIRFLRKDGASFYAQSDIIAFQKNQDTAGITFSDITDRKQALKVLQARVRLTEFAVSHSLEGVLQATLDEMEALTGSTIGFYHFLEADQTTLTLQAWSSNTIRNMCSAEGRGHRYDIAQAGVWVDCIRERRPLIHNDYLSLAHRNGLPPGHAPVFRELVTPVFRNGCIKAIIGVGNKAENYHAQDIEMVSLLADLAWDIAERKRAEETLRESERKYRMVADFTYDWEFWLAPDGKYVYVSPACERITGYTPAEFQASPQLMTEIIHPDDKKMWVKHLTIAKTIALANQIEFRIIARDGTQRWIGHVCQPVYNSDGNFIGQRGSNRDITEHKQAEAALQKSRTLLNETGKMAKVGGWEFDVGTKELLWTEEVYRIHEVDLSFEQTVDKAISFYAPDSKPGITEAVRRATEFGEPFDSELKIITAKGNLRWVHAIGKANYTLNKITSISGTFQDITERKIAEDKLRFQSEIMTNMAEAVYLIRAEDGIIVYANQIFEKMFGYAHGEMLGKHVSIVNAPAEKNPEETAEEIMKIIAETGAWQGEVNNIRKDGILFCCYANVSVFDHSKYGRVLLSIHTDITKRKLAEMKLRESEERFRTLTHLAPVGVYLTDPDGRCQYVNQRWLDMAGMTLEEALGDGWNNSIHPDDLRLILTKWRQMVESRGTWSLEYRFQTPGGKITWVLGLASELHNSFGEKIGYIGVNTDITERKHIEETLRQSEERYRTLVETMSEGFIVLNKDMTIVYVNNQFCRISGYEKEELIGKSISYYFDEENQIIVIEQFIKRKHGQSGVYEVEITRKDSSRGFVAISSKPIFDSENSFQGSLAVISDITLRKETDTMFLTEHQAMKTQVQTTMTQIDSLNREIQGYNHALKVLLKNSQDEQKAVEEKIISNVREMVAPFLDKLKNTRLSETQKNLVDIVENNLSNIISPFVSRLKAELRDFTPMEIQVANLIREGKTNKDIGDILAISEYTAMFHRKNIRKKLGLQHQSINLRTYLLSLS
jgi:PAS domain S-box-containing protein